MISSRPSPDLMSVVGLVNDYCEHRAEGAEAGDITTSLQLKRALINRLELDFARDAACFASGYDETVHINPSPVSWMRENLRMTSHAAATAVCVGEEGDQLERSATALGEGRIGFAHLGLMASLAEALSTSRTATAAFDETSLLAKAERLAVQPFRTACSHLRHAADRQGFLEEQLQDREYRALTMRSGGGGFLEISGFLDPEGGALLHAALDPLARPGGTDDERPREHRYADALVELCAHSLDAGLVPQTASQRSHLQVTTTLETLRDLAGAPAGEMEFAGTIAAATVQRLSCDATITRVLVDAASAVIDVGRSERVVPPATRRALNVRDRGCRWPGCDRPPSWTAAHHIVHWTHWGPTDTPNLVLLCRRHHRSVHEDGWQVVRVDSDEVRVIPPLRGGVARAREPDPGSTA